MNKPSKYINKTLPIFASAPPPCKKPLGGAKHPISTPAPPLCTPRPRACKKTQGSEMATAELKTLHDELNMLLKTVPGKAVSASKV